MMEFFHSLWDFEVRLLPVMLSLSIFGWLHLIRKLTAVEYSPSYFAIFPVSLINYQLSVYLGEYYGGEYIRQKGERPKIPNLYLKAFASFFLTVFFVPLLVGFSSAFYLSLKEFRVFLFLLILWEGWHCLKATYNYSYFVGDWKKVIKFFGSFYMFYLFSLFFVIRLGYSKTLPYVEMGNISELFLSLEDFIIPTIINILIIGVISNIFAHWLINKDALEPEIDVSEEKDEDNAGV